MRLRKQSKGKEVMKSGKKKVKFLWKGGDEIGKK